ncbi:hypothetical protein NGA_0122102 [Nannochloropsis gaditana CCMP526]|nr:hypothetical protein NGA_0122102 [Nannochloropsis gaditana CCMP526]EKU21459.1 hypothetical protein NGA_0122102 [Nannochloropsis gaditana CCMP526]|eukprot:XP_005854900.1 hypothetical protein NGA_0122102 [Nannochloropsis gaditana CCMP526]
MCLYQGLPLLSRG